MTDYMQTTKRKRSCFNFGNNCFNAVLTLVKAWYFTACW